MIDDEEALLRALRRLFAQHADVTTFSDAQSALAWLENTGPVDLILCDVHLPGVDGLTFRAQLASRLPGLERAVVFASGDFPDDRVVVGYGSLPNRCVGKPFRRAILFALLENDERQVA